MIKIISLLLLISFCFACKMAEPKLKCIGLKTGHFSYKSYSNGMKFFIERTDSLQKETNEVTGKIRTLKIRWVNDCEYELTILSEENSDSDHIKHYPMGRILNTKILTVTDTYYTFHSEMKGNPHMLDDTLRIIDRN